MPVTPTYPGVYIEELQSGVRPIAGVATSIAAFVGTFARGPLNQPIQIFSFGDFERNFGGLFENTETSYTIQQFFLNGGNEAWIVRVAGGSPVAASVILLDENSAGTLQATVGRQIGINSVDDPGEWGNNLRIDVDYNATDPSSEFNLVVSEITQANGREEVVQSEVFRNLGMTPGQTNYVLDVVNNGSKLIQLTHLDSGSNPNTNRPVSTGTNGDDASAAHATLVDNDQFNMTITLPDASTIVGACTLSFPGGATPTNVREVRGLLESAIRGALVGGNPTSDPLFTRASVEVVDGQNLRVSVGRTGSSYDPEIVITFTDTTGTPTDTMNLSGIGDIFPNVQQYVLGSSNNSAGTIGFRGNTAVGSNGSNADANALRGSDGTNKTGIYALRNVDLFNILCLPEASTLDTPGTNVNFTAVMSDATAFCEEERAFLVIDVPAEVVTMDDARDWMEANAGTRHKNAAVYYPRIRIPDSLNDNRLKEIGPSGTIAGLYSRTDAARGIWKAPAGIEARLRNVPELMYKLTDPENGQLNPIGVNCLRNFDVFGNVSWGSRTLVGADTLASDWKYVPVRRLALFIEETLFRGTHWVVFEPNDETLWAQIRLSVGSFMQGLFRQGAFQGTTPDKAYLVKCDSETTTQADIDLGRVNIYVGFAPLKPAEFVVIQIQQLAGQTQ